MPVSLHVAQHGAVPGSEPAPGSGQISPLQMVGALLVPAEYVSVHDTDTTAYALDGDCNIIIATIPGELAGADIVYVDTGASGAVLASGAGQIILLNMTIPIFRRAGATHLLLRKHQA